MTVTLIVPQMTAVTLTKREVQAAQKLAREQQRRDRGAGIVDRAFYTGRDIALEGILGQEAVGKYLGIKPDRTTHVRRGGADIRYNGIPIDVKACGSRIGATWTVAGHKRARDAVVLVFAVARIPEPLDSTKVWLAGFLDWDGLQPFRMRNVVENPYAKSAWCYRVRAEDLLPIEDLVPTLDEVLAV